MLNVATSARLLLLGALMCCVMSRPAKAASIITDGLNASLDTGSLAGTRFAVSFSYDGAQVQPVGVSYITLITFDFTLLGVHFTRNDIFQGGQVIFRNGVLDNVMASFQAVLPPQSPVVNITFGFGGPGFIGYLDLNRQSGNGSFTFASATVSEPKSGELLALAVSTLLGFRIFKAGVLRRVRA
jgi:hypothetical protein